MFVYNKMMKGEMTLFEDPKEFIPVSTSCDDFCPSLFWLSFFGFIWMLWFTKFFTSKFGYVRLKGQHLLGKTADLQSVAEQNTNHKFWNLRNLFPTNKTVKPGFNTIVMHRKLDKESTERLYRK